MNQQILPMVKRLLMLFTFLIVVLATRAQVPVTSGGEGQRFSDPYNEANGGNATGLGCGGGGANWYGGHGGDGKLGGGGGGAAGFSENNRVGGKGGNGTLVVASYIDAAFFKTDVYVTGTSFTIEPNVTSIKVWAIGAGGGGAGSTGSDGTSGGGGGAGGVVYLTSAVTAGNIITYSLGTGGAGGIDVNNGSNGGSTTATIGAAVITGLGGQGGLFNTAVDAPGGAFTGGDGGANGGIGRGAGGDQGGGGGGGIGGTAGNASTGTGGDGANAGDVSGLFSALSSASILPVTWKSFAIANQQGKALLLWETSYEQGVSEFTIQYSTDGARFYNVGTVPATNSHNGHAYQYVHHNPAKGTGFYRVYQTSLNGKNSYTNTLKSIINAAIEKNLTLTAGNVASSVIKFQLHKPGVVNLLDFDGKLIRKKFFGIGNHEFNVNEFKPGYYILTTANETQRVLIQ